MQKAIAATFLFLAAVGGRGADVDPATYVGNVYGTVSDFAAVQPVPNARILLFDAGSRASVLSCRDSSDVGACIASSAIPVRGATTSGDGSFLINFVPAPNDGRDYTVAVIADGYALLILESVHVLPGAVMALETTFRIARRGHVQTLTAPGPNATWRYRHEHAENAAAATSSPRSESFAGNVFATREGLVGGTTANGHVIVTGDRFAALPTRRALSTNFGHEREVGVSTATHTTVVPVWDVGPWNTHDDYWNPADIRETFKDLPRGKPESQAAFLDGYNGGFDERGRKVLNPAGIDLADGTFRIDLALTDNAWVDVEYLWVDTTGPTTGAVTISPVPFGINIDAVVSDTSTGNSSVAGAELFVDSIGEAASGLRLAAADGAFDSPVESIHGWYAVTAWSPGTTHTLYVHGRDAFGNWGEMSSTTALAPAATVPPRRRAAGR